VRESVPSDSKHHSPYLSSSSSKFDGYKSEIEKVRWNVFYILVLPIQFKHSFAQTLLPLSSSPAKVDRKEKAKENNLLPLSSSPVQLNQDQVKVGKKTLLHFMVYIL
jgi:hypothetical protein